MRKITVFALCAILALSTFIAACGNKKTVDNKQGDVDPEALEASAEEGEITGLPFTIGDNAASVKAHYTKKENGKSVKNYNESKSGEYPTVTTDDAVYYFSADDDTLLAAVSFKNDTYNFRFGTNTVSDVRYFLGNGYEERPTADSLTFLPDGIVSGDNIMTLTYPYGDCGMKFIFSNTKLSAIVLFNNAKFDFSKCTA